MNIRRGQNYIYPILNWNSKPGSAMIAAFGVIFLGATIHSLLVLIQTLRSKIHKKMYKEYQVVSSSNTKNTLSEIEAQHQQSDNFHLNIL